MSPSTEPPLPLPVTVVIPAHNRAGNIEHAVSSTLSHPDAARHATHQSHAWRTGHRTFVVLYGDVLIFEPFAAVLRTHEQVRAMATLCVYEHDDTGGKSVVEIDARGRMTSFAEKEPTRTGAGLVNAGMYIIDPDLIAWLPPDTILDFGHDVFPASLRAGHHLHVHIIPRPVLDIGTPEDLARALSLNEAGSMWVE